MKKKIFVTTFNHSLFEKYAHKLIDSYINTEQDFELYCYVEDDINLYPKDKKITYLNLFVEQPSCFKFIERNKFKSNKNSQISYLLDSVKFSYKVLPKVMLENILRNFFILMPI
tara:strand:+ start:297 stop:638 length:342 start_codon:yes stop_codon:yes gene_type:complete